MNSQADHSVPVPFLFNPLKHHVGFIRKFIAICRQERLPDSELRFNLQKMGNSVIDIYYGSLMLHELIENIAFHLRSTDCFSSDKYRQFIEDATGKFINIQAQDGSEWTLLRGADKERYIHIHPARNAVFSVRIRATALKTAVILKICFEKEMGQEDFLGLVNIVRMKFLNESPLKNQHNTKGIRKVLEFL